MAKAGNGAVRLATMDGVKGQRPAAALPVSPVQYIRERWPG